MDTRNEIREFLTSRRAKLKAAEVGLPDYGPRRVPGLRREEVAVLAGVSVPYYTRLERGDLAGASDIGNDRLDILGANPLGRALFVDMFDGQERPNAARFVFLDPRARDFYLDWDRIARDVVASLRSSAGRNPYDRDLTDLVGELSTRSDEFRQHWAKHDVRFHISGIKHFHHSQVGDLELNYERLEVVFDTGLIIFTYTADPGTRSAEALNLLGSLAATTDAERASAAP
jgi:transcriptional regulator with XRE-family HTH domain